MLQMTRMKNSCNSQPGDHKTRKTHTSVFRTIVEARVFKSADINKKPIDMDMNNFVRIGVDGFGMGPMGLQLGEKGKKGATADLATVLCQASPFDIKQICDYEVLSSDEIVDYVVKFVQEINGIVELNTTITRMLLSHCKWDKDVMVERFYDNADKLYKEAHVINPASVNSIASQTDDKECGICFSELSPSMLAESTCGHQFCTSCWSEYLKVKIMDEGVGNSIACAASDCDMIIDDERVIQLVGDEKAKIRYQQLITNSFVQQNKLLRWCPAIGCSFVIKAAYVALKPICCYCKCGHEFCFGCSKEYHAPVTCALLGQYETHEQLGLFRFLPNPDAHSSLRFGSDGKIKICPNPNCQVQLQKDEGCNVVKCRNCDSVFCWECLNRYNSKSDAYRHWCKAIENDEKKEPVEAMTEVAPDVPVTSTQLPTNTVNDDTNKEPVVEMAEATPNVPVTSTQLLKNAPNNDTNMEVDVMNLVGYTTGYLEQVTTNAAGPSTSRVTIGLQNRIAERRNRPNFRQLFHLNNKHNNAVDALVSAHIFFVTNRKWLKECHERWRDVLSEFECASLEWIRSCRTLKYFAIFDIYAVDTTELTLLQNLVQNLEVAVAELQTSICLISGPFPKICEYLYDNIKRNVLPAYANCQRRRRALLDYVNEGFDNEWWTFKAEP